MDGVSRAAGVGPTIELDGRRLTVSAKILRHYAEIEAEIIAARGNPFDLIRQMAEALPDRPEVALMAVQRAFTEAKTWRMVTVDELDQWLDYTWRGRCFRTWLAIRDNDRAALTLEKVTELYTDEFQRLVAEQGGAAAERWDATICGAIMQAEGQDELGNSNTSQPAGTAAEATSASPGKSSSESSP